MNLIIDNYDSFTYNLYQYIGAIDGDIGVYRNDEITAREVAAKKPDHIIISPGPKYPKDAGICIDLIKSLYTEIPILLSLIHIFIARSRAFFFSSFINYSPFLTIKNSPI